MFQKKLGKESGLEYASTSKAWMTGSLFAEWLKFFIKITLQKRNTRMLTADGQLQCPWKPSFFVGAF